MPSLHKGYGPGLAGTAGNALASVVPMPGDVNAARIGAARWQTKVRMKPDGVSPAAVVITDALVYTHTGGGVTAYSIADGKVKWQGKKVVGNYMKPADIFVVGGKVWVGGQGVPKSFDALTGEPDTPLTQKMLGPMQHDRCYRNFITETYFINSKTGDKVFIAGRRVQFPVDKFEELKAGCEGKSGGVLWMASAKDGSKLAEYKLDSPPAWDGLAAAEGTVQCLVGR
jgi:hypothetical protein